MKRTAMKILLKDINIKTKHCKISHIYKMQYE